MKFLNQQGLEGIPMVFVSQLILALLFTRAGLRPEPLKQAWKATLGIALTGGSAILCFTYALMYGDVVRVMVLFYLLPVWGVLGGRVFLHEHIDRVRWFGVAIAIVGAFLILGGPRIFDLPPSWIDLLALLSGLFFAANNMFFRGAVSLSLASKLMMMFYGCSAISGLLILSGVQAWPSSLPAVSWGWLVLYAFTWLLLANLGSQWAVTRMEAGRSSIIIIMELVAAVVSAMVINKTRLSLVEWGGCLLVVTAAFLEASRANNEQIAPSRPLR